MNRENSIDNLQQALRYHQAGDLQKAQKIYADVLMQQPENADALHLSALIAFQTTQYDLAETLIEEAIKQNPNIVEYLNNAGEIYRVQNKFEMAQGFYHRAIELNTNYAEAHNNLALVFKQVGDIDAAFNHLKRALDINPDYADAYNNLGILLFDKKAWKEAEEKFRSAISLHPQHAEAYNNLGLLLKEQGLYKEAMVVFEQALSLKPQAADIYNNIAITLQMMGLYEEAIAHLKLALQLLPAYPDAWNNLGFIQYEMGYLKEANSCFQRTLVLEPKHAEAHVNLAHLYLLQGQFKSGWHEYQWRFKLKENRENLTHYSFKHWYGEEIKSKSLFVNVEQGFGDIIQFIRYLPLLKERVSHIYFNCNEKLHHLFEHFKKDVTFITGDVSAVEIDLQVPLLDLPGILKTDSESIPQLEEYISVDSELINIWRKRLPQGKELKIGLCWQGNPKQKRDQHRSVPLVLFKTLFENNDHYFVNLQKGYGQEQLDDFIYQERILNYADEMDESQMFHDTAAVIQNLDLIITVDTAIAHLAAAMGKPTWILLAHTPDWRWLLQGENSAWYPSVRLFRQDVNRDWTTVMANLTEAIRQFSH